jgi:hypothetical protein
VVLEWVALAGLLASLLCLVPKLPRRLFNPAALIAALAVVGLGLEGLARGAAIVDPEVQGFPTNRSRMWRRRYVRQNAAGFRDVEHALEVAPGVRRLLIVGDSYAAGSGIERPGDRFGSRLADALAEATGTAWEPIFAARSDTHTLDHLRFLSHGLRFRPDLVVLLYVFNDIDYLHPLTRRTVLTEHPRNIGQRLHPVRVLFTNSFAFQELYARLRHLTFASHGAPEAGNHPYADSTVLLRHLTDLRAFGTSARAAGSAAVIVPFDVSVAASQPARVRYRRFVAAAEAAGVPVWPADQVFRELPFETLTVGSLDLHPNELANDLLARAFLPRALEVVGCSQHPGGGRARGIEAKPCVAN